MFNVRFCVIYEVSINKDLTVMLLIAFVRDIIMLRGVVYMTSVTMLKLNNGRTSVQSTVKYKV